MRIGFFGGTFDPPHLGHLAVAQAAASAFSLERVLITPTGHQPLKADSPSASFSDRMAMVELLCHGSTVLQASDIDTPEPDGEPNYTIDTLTRLRSSLSSEIEIFSIIGVDAFLTLRRWREPERLLEMAEWIVVSRPSFSLDDLQDLGLTPPQLARVHVLDGVAVPFSATEIRTLLSNGSDTNGFLPKSVFDYIGSHHLYGL